MRWQAEALRLLEFQSDRKILVVLCEQGMTGKTRLRKFLETEGAIVIPTTLTSVGQMSGWLCQSITPRNRTKVNTIVYDLPRALGFKASKNHAVWYEIMGAIEAAKDGSASDWRYKNKHARFKTPRVILFTNVLPPENLLSKDRWKVLRPEQFPEDLPAASPSPLSQTR